MIWLIGAGPMAVEYGKVLKGLNAEFKTIGRSEKSAQEFEKKTGCPVITGGIDSFLTTQPEAADYAIIATSVEQLSSVAELIISYGVKKILLEKPGGIKSSEIQGIVKNAENNNANVLLAYNRRFYASVIEAEKIINEDGGVVSFDFEFTEWSHIIAKSDKAEAVKQKWFLANSSHVADLAFFLGGVPKEISTYHSGELDWHASASCFTGAGTTDTGALFSYRANWAAPGRWSLDILTAKHRLIFCPMEKLKIQKIGSIEQNNVNIDYSLEEKYKPGLYLQVEAFLTGDESRFCSINDQLLIFEKYCLIAGYGENNDA